MDVGSIDLSTVDEVGYFWDAVAESDEEREAGDGDADSGDADSGAADSVDDEEGAGIDDPPSTPSGGPSGGPSGEPSAPPSGPPSTPYHSISSVPTSHFFSRRAGLRQFLASNVDFGAILYQTKFLPDEGLGAFVKALIELCEGPSEGARTPVTPESSEQPESSEPAATCAAELDPSIDEFVSNGSSKTAVEIIKACAVVGGSGGTVGGRAFCEVLLCEVALRNKDRIKGLFGMLEDHYKHVLGGSMGAHAECTFHTEKCVTGLLRICHKVGGKEKMFERSMGLYKVLLKSNGEVVGQLAPIIIESVWRFCSTNVTVWSGADSVCWNVLFDVVKACVERDGVGGGFEICTKAFRVVHLLLNAVELKECLPMSVVGVMGVLLEIVAGVNEGDSEGDSEGELDWSFRNNMAVAVLDLLLLLHTRLGSGSREGGDDLALQNNWRPILDSVGGVAVLGCVTLVRQHALTVLCLMLEDRHGGCIAQKQLGHIVMKNCVEVARARISDIVGLEITAELLSYEKDVTLELRCCVRLLFKPLLRNVEGLRGDTSEASVKRWEELWLSVVDTVMVLIGDNTSEASVGDNEEEGEGGGTTVGDEFFASSRAYARSSLRDAVLALNGVGCFEGELMKETVARVGGEMMNFEVNPNEVS